MNRFTATSSISVGFLCNTLPYRERHVGFVAGMLYEQRQEFDEPMAVVAGMSSSFFIAGLKGK